MSHCLLAIAPSSSLASILSDPLVLLALGVGLAVVFYILVLRRTAKSPAQRPGPPAAGRRSLAEREIEVLLDELEHMASAVSQRFNAQSQRLETLIREAQQATAALEATMARARAAPLASRIMSQSPDTGHDSGLAALARHTEIYELADAGESAPAIAQKLQRPAGEIELILALRSGGIS